MDTSTTFLVILGGGGLAYWLYTTSQQNQKQKAVMMPKHDVPKQRQRVNDVLNEAQSRHNTQKHLYHRPIGPIMDRYIKPPLIKPPIARPIVIPGIFH